MLFTPDQTKAYKEVQKRGWQTPKPKHPGSASIHYIYLTHVAVESVAATITIDEQWLFSSFMMIGIINREASSGCSFFHVIEYVESCQGLRCAPNAGRCFVFILALAENWPWEKMVLCSHEVK